MMSAWQVPAFVFVVFQSLCCVRLFATQRTVAHQAPLNATIFPSLLKFRSTESIILSNHLILCCPLLLCLQSLPDSGFFQWVGSLHQVAKYWSFSFSNSPSNEYSGLISFRIDWFFLPAGQRNSQESSPEPLLESINSFALSLLYGPTLTPIHDYWKNHSFDHTDLCWQSDVSAS